MSWLGGLMKIFAVWGKRTFLCTHCWKDKILKNQSPGDAKKSFCLSSLLWDPMFSQPLLVNWTLSSPSGSINYHITKCWTLICIFAPDSMWQTNYFWRTPLALHVWQFAKWSEDVSVTCADPTELIYRNLSARRGPIKAKLQPDIKHTTATGTKTEIKTSSLEHIKYFISGWPLERFYWHNKSRV